MRRDLAGLVAAARAVFGIDLGEAGDDLHYVALRIEARARLLGRSIFCAPFFRTEQGVRMEASQDDDTDCRRLPGAIAMLVLHADLARYYAPGRGISREALADLMASDPLLQAAAVGDEIDLERAPMTALMEMFEDVPAPAPVQEMEGSLAVEPGM